MRDENSNVLRIANAVRERLQSDWHGMLESERKRTEAMIKEKEESGRRRWPVLLSVLGLLIGLAGYAGRALVDQGGARNQLVSMSASIQEMRSDSKKLQEQLAAIAAQGQRTEGVYQGVMTRIEVLDGRQKDLETRLRDEGKEIRLTLDRQRSMIENNKTTARLNARQLQILGSGNFAGDSDEGDPQ